MPDLTVIDGGGPEKDERERQRARDRAKDDFSWAIREVAANMLRIIRGAGKPYELLPQMQRAINAAVKFKEVHQHWPQEVITNDLQIQSEDDKLCREGKLPQATIDRWWEDGTFELNDGRTHDPPRVSPDNCVRVDRPKHSEECGNKRTPRWNYELDTESR